MVGVKNTGEEPINGEIWLDELRLGGIKKEKVACEFNLILNYPTLVLQVLSIVAKMQIIIDCKRGYQNQIITLKTLTLMQN